MNAQKLTQKSIAAISEAQSLATEYQNPQIETIHLLYALLSDGEGLIPQLLQKMGVMPSEAREEAKKQLERLPHMSVSSREAGKVYVSSDVDKILAEAERKAEHMKDEYVSVEHIMLGILERPGDLKEMFERLGIKKNDFMNALQTVRGNRRVTSDSPEATYDVLKKYGSDLVELAKQNKLDPVIGRDQEIRNVIRILSRKTKNNPVLMVNPAWEKQLLPRAWRCVLSAGMCRRD